MDDAALRGMAARAAEGDLDAVEDLVRGLHGHLFSFLHLLRVPEGEMEDVAQDVVIRLYRSLGDYRTDQPFLPFLRGIARHAVADLWRSRAREERRVSAFQAFVEAYVTVDPGARHLDVRTSRLRQCLERLPARHREIVALRYERGLESSAIAREVAQSAVAVRQALSRIRRTLRACVQAAT